MRIWFWLGAAVVFGLLEAATAGLVSIWFAIGSLAALVAALLGAGQGLQMTVFLIVSALTLLLTRPLAKKMIHGKTIPTNADRVLGQPAQVTEAICNDRETGAVRTGGKIWTARSAVGSDIPAGAQVLVERMEGVTLFVRPLEDEKEEI